MHTHAKEWLLAVDTKHDEGPIAVLVIVLGDGLVLVLAGSIPDLHLDLQPVNLANLVHKIQPNSHHVVVDELAFRIAQEDVGLTYAAVANYDDFLQDVVLLVDFVLAAFHLEVLARWGDYLFVYLFLLLLWGLNCLFAFVNIC